MICGLKKKNIRAEEVVEVVVLHQVSADTLVVFEQPSDGVLQTGVQTSLSIEGVGFTPRS